jgi:ribonuclease P protein component
VNAEHRLRSRADNRPRTPDNRLRTAADFQRVRERSPRVWPHPLLVLHVAPNDFDRARVGITVSGRVGKAVVRNRVRRRLREAVRARLGSLQTGYDLLVVARPGSSHATWQQLCAALDTVLQRAGATAATGLSV